MGSFTLVATFALLIGAAVASIGFKEGHEYEYKYYGKAISGIPNLKNQFAGVILRGDVRFQRLADQIVLMKIERMEAIELNGPVPTGPVEKVLVDLQREAPQTIQQTVELTQLAPVMRHPVRIQYENGKIRSFEVSRENPEWVLNIKKGIMSMIKLKLDESLAHGKAQEMNVVSKQYNQDIFLNYNVMEEDTQGMCLSTYAISSQPWEARPNQQVLNVTKYRNYNKCNKFQQYTLKTLQDEKCPNCKAANEEVYSEVAVLKYNLRGSQHSFEIEKVEADEQFIYAPYTATADYYLTNTSRALVLRHKQPIQQHLQTRCGGNCKVLNSLQFKLVSLEKLQAKNKFVNGEFDLHKAPITPFNAHWTLQKEHQQQHVKVEELVQLIRNIAQEIRNVEQEQKPEILTKTIQAKKMMRMLNFQQIEQVYHECKRSDNSITKRVCQDVMVMCGSAPAILVIKKAIESEEIRGEEAAILLQQIPVTIMAPHFTLIHKIKELTRSPVAMKDSQVYTTAWLTYGSLIGVACNGTGNTRETASYIPKNFFCPNEVKLRMIQEIGQELRQTRSHWRQVVLIHALGNTMAPEAVQALLPIISARTTDCPVLRTKAIHALTGAAKVRPNLVLKVLAPVFFNVDEVAEVRAAALSVMISCHPTNQFLSKIAASTWKEPSQQVGSFVYSTLKNLAEADMPCLKDLKKDAKIALELANQDFDGNLLDSKNMIFDDDNMDVFNMFNTLQTYWIRSNESIIPTEIMAKLNTTFAGNNFNQFVAQLHLKGVDEVLNRMFGPKSAFYQMRNVADLFKKEKAESRKGFHQLVQALQIDTEERETSDFLMNFFIRIYDTQARNFHITKQSVKNFMTGNVQNDLAKQFYQLIFGNGLTLNHHKLFNAHERMVEFATPIGFPVVITVDSPVYMGVKGHMNVQLDSSRNPNSVVPTNVRLSANIRPVVIMKKLTTVGLILPYDNKHAAAVVSRKTLISLPINGQINFNLPEAKVSFVLGQSEHQRLHHGSQQLPIVLYKVKPLTVIHKYTTPLSYLHQENAKTIQTMHRPRVWEEVKMTRTLGLPIMYQSRHEHEMTTVNSLIDQIYENGVWNTLNYIWLHPQTFKYSEHIVRVNLHSAETKEVKGVFDFDFTNSKLQRNLRDGQYTPNQIWSFLFGWANLPLPCKAANELNANVYDNEFDQYNKEWNTYGWTGYGDETEGQLNKYNKKYSFDFSGLNKFSFWKNWQSQRDLLDSDVDIDEEEPKGNWFNNYRMSRRYPFASKYSADKEYEWATNYGSYDNAQIHRANIAEHVPAWKLYVKIQAIGGQERSVVALITGKRNFAQLKDLISAEIKIRHPKINGNQMTICKELVAQYPAIPCAYDHSFNPASVAPIHIQSKTTWGHNGCSAQNHLDVIVKIGKSAKQLYFEQEAKPWYFKQCMEERSKGLKFNEACSELYDQVTALNKIELVARYNNVPAVLKNITYKVDDLLKAQLYSHMSNNALMSGKHQPGKVRIVAEIQPDKDAVDVKIEKPTETTIFKEVPTSVQPLSAHRTIAQQVADALTDRQIPATCDISGGRYINTFNNVTYKHEMGQCTYLAARDCSPNGLFAVLVSGPRAQKSGAGNGIFVEVQLLKNTIKMTPLTSRMDKYMISVNGQTQELTQAETIIVESGAQAPGTPEPLAYITLTGHFVHIKAPVHGIEIKYDGKNVRVQTSYFYAGKLCGLCGNFDGESNNEFEGPHGCIYAKARDFAESCIISNGECQQKAHQARMTCAKNNQETTAVYPQLKNIQSALFTTEKWVDESSDYTQSNTLSDISLGAVDYEPAEYLSGRYYGKQGWGMWNEDDEESMLNKYKTYGGSDEDVDSDFSFRSGNYGPNYFNTKRNIKVQKNQLNKLYNDEESTFGSSVFGQDYEFNGLINRDECQCEEGDENCQCDFETCKFRNCRRQGDVYQCQGQCFGRNQRNQCMNCQCNGNTCQCEDCQCFGENCETQSNTCQCDDCQCSGDFCHCNQCQCCGSQADEESSFRGGLGYQNIFGKKRGGFLQGESDEEIYGEGEGYGFRSGLGLGLTRGGDLLESSDELTNEFKDKECYGENCEYKRNYYGKGADEICYGENCEEKKFKSGMQWGSESDYSAENVYGIDRSDVLSNDEVMGFRGIDRDILSSNDELRFRGIDRDAESSEELSGFRGGAWNTYGDDEVYGGKYNKYNKYNVIGDEDEYDVEDEDVAFERSQMMGGSVYKNQRDASYCTVYRNKVSYGKPDQLATSYNPFYNLYSRLYGKYGRDDSYYTSGDKVCFSINAHKQCKAECQPKGEQMRTVRYHCMDSESYEAKQLLRLQPYQRLTQLQDKSVHFTKQEYIPTYCQAY